MLVQHPLDWLQNNRLLITQCGKENLRSILLVDLTEQPRPLFGGWVDRQQPALLVNRYLAVLRIKTILTSWVVHRPHALRGDKSLVLSSQPQNF